MLAAPASAAYRFRSYARRNRVQVVAGAVVLATLAASDLLYRFVERPMIALGARLARRRPTVLQAAE